MVKLKRAYAKPEKSDGYRILVDRLWPRGIKKDKLALRDWAREIAPSSEIRKEFSHRPDKWDAFRSSYRQELRAPEARRVLEQLARLAEQGDLTLVYAARDQEHNNAVVLKDVLTRQIKRRSSHA